VNPPARIFGAADDVRDRVGVDRVDGKKQAGDQRGSGSDSQTARQPPHTGADGGVQQDVHEVKRPRGSAMDGVLPAVGLDGQRAVQQVVAIAAVALGPVGGGPGAQRRTGRGHVGIGRDDGDIVKREVVGKRVGVDEQCGQRDDHAAGAHPDAVAAHRQWGLDRASGHDRLEIPAPARTASSAGYILATP